MSKNKDTKNETLAPLSLTVTLRDIVDSVQSLQEITSQKTSATLSFTLGIVLRTINPFLQEYAKQRNALRDELYDKKADGKSLEPKVENADKLFSDQVDAMLDGPVALVGIGRIRMSLLVDEGIKLDGQDAAALYWLLKNDMQSLFDAE